MDFGTILSVGSTLLGGALQADSAEDAASAQDAATRASIEEQRRQFDLNRADLAPYRRTGSAAVNRLAQLLGLPGSNVDEEGFADAQRLWNAQNEKGEYFQRVGPEPTKEMYTTPTGDVSDFGSLNKKFTLADFWDDPVTKASYQFGLDTGTKALGNMAGARGNRNSGAQLKALTRFATDYTGGQAAGSQARFVGDQDRTFNRLSGVAGTGQTAATTGAMLGQQGANTVSGLMGAQGNARGAAAIGGANAVAGGLQNAGNTLANWWNRQQNPNAGNYTVNGAFSPYYAMSSENYG